MKKILLVNFDKRWGGGQEYLIDLVKVCLSEGFAVGQLVAPRSVSEKRFGEKFSAKSNYSLYSIARNNLIGIWQLAKIAGQYNLVHIHREHDLWIGVLLKLCNPKLKLLFSQPVLPGKTRLLMRFYPRVICNSEFIRERFQKKYPGKKCEVIYPCVDTELLQSVAVVTSELAGSPKVLMSGAYWKNQKELVSIFKMFLKDAPEARLYFIGPSEEGPQVSELRDAIDKENLNAQVTILAPRGREEYLKLLKQIDIFAYTHLQEAFGIAVLEAALVEKPVVAYEAGGILEILQNYPRATLVKPGDRAGFAAALTNVSQHKFLPEINLAELQRKFSKESFGTAHKRIYRELLYSS